MQRFASRVERTRERWGSSLDQAHSRGAYDVDQCATARAFRVPVDHRLSCGIPVIVVALSASG